MTMNDATESAYKHGYEDGYRTAINEMMLAAILAEDNNEEKENEQDT